jgi:hypothetical protein
MSTIVYESYVNGTTVHYYANSSQPCHAAIIVGNHTVVDGIPTVTDLIQQDAISLGVVVPLRHNAVDYDTAATTNGTWHYSGSCPRT